MNERVSAAIVRLDEAEALGGIEPFYWPVVMMNSFKAMLSDRRTGVLRMVIAIDFDREVRSGAVLIARQPKFSKQKIDKPLIAHIANEVNF